jgi:hypothetical protein
LCWPKLGNPLVSPLLYRPRGFIHYQESIVF